MNPLVIDIGGTNVKAWSPEGRLLERLPTGKEFTPENLLEAARRWVQETRCERIALGYPGKVINGRPAREPWNLADGWVDFDYEGRLGLPVRIMNDAGMQALGSYDLGTMLFLGLGTSVGSALIVDGFVIPLELGSIPYSKERSLEDMLSKKGLERSGRRRWRSALISALPKLQYAFSTDYIVLGGGNASRLKGKLPDFVRTGNNRDAHLGGVRLWEAQQINRVHWFPPKPDEAKETEKLAG